MHLHHLLLSPPLPLEGASVEPAVVGGCRRGNEAQVRVEGEVQVLLQNSQEWQAGNLHLAGSWRWGRLDVADSDVRSCRSARQHQSLALLKQSGSLKHWAKYGLSTRTW